MKLLVCLYGLLFFFLPSIAQNETELLKSVKAKLDKVANYKAKGKINIDVPFIKASPSAITVYFKQPDKFKIEKEEGLSIFPKGGVSMNVSSMLSNTNYTAVPAGEALVKGVTTKVIKLLPLDEASDVVLTTLYIDAKDALVRKASVTTKESGSYEVEMDYSRYSNWGLPDKVVFSFNTKDYKLPKGLTFEYEKGATKKQEAPKSTKGRIEVFYSEYSINKGVSNAVFADGKKGS